MASATLILAGVQPVETAEVVEAVAALLRANAPFMAHVQRGRSARAGTLHAHRLPLTSGASEAESVPLYALLREMATVGASSTPETPNGIVAVPLQLQLSLDPAGVPSPDRVLSRGHVLAWRALEGALVAGGEGEGLFVSAGPLTRTGMPSPARPDTSGRLYSSAYFTAPVRPVSPPPP